MELLYVLFALSFLTLTRYFKIDNKQAMKNLTKQQ